MERTWSERYQKSQGPLESLHRKGKDLLLSRGTVFLQCSEHTTREGKVGRRAGERLRMGWWEVSGTWTSLRMENRRRLEIIRASWAVVAHAFSEAGTSLSSRPA